MPKTVRLGTDSSGRAVLMSPLMSKWWSEYVKACQAKGFTPVVTQGAFMAQAGGGAAASAGYHDLGGCLDLRVWDRTTAERQFMVRHARRMGAGAWIRDQRHGGMDPHLHLVLGADDAIGAGETHGEAGVVGAALAVLLAALAAGAVRDVDPDDARHRRFFGQDSSDFSARFACRSVLRTAGSFAFLRRASWRRR